MTTYRLFPATSGPSNATSYTGNFIAGVTFAIEGGGNWFEGYWWWVSPGSGATPVAGSTAPVKCALWASLSTTQGYLVPGSVVTSGTLTAGQWNYIPLAAPVQLAPSYSPNNSTWGSMYVATVGVNGNFPDTNGFWGTGGPGVAGILNGPLFAYSGLSTAGGTHPAPYGMSQGIFSSVNSDPSIAQPGQSSSVDNFWVDVQISDSAPSGYGGSYRIWPNKPDSNNFTVGDNAVDYVVATEIHLSQQCTLNNIWYYSQTAAHSLATECDVWSVGGQISVAKISAPSWLTVSGSAAVAGGGWVKAAFPTNTTLPAGIYRVSVYNSGGTAGSWNATDSSTGYWTTGVGLNGITNGPVSAPNQATAQPANFYPGSGTGSTGGQPVFTDNGSDVFPNLTTGTNPPQNYWVDLEVTPVNPSLSGPAANVSVAGLTGLFNESISGTAGSVTVASFAGQPVQSMQGPAGSVTVTGLPGAIVPGVPSPGIAKWYGRLLSTSWQ